MLILAALAFATDALLPCPEGTVRTLSGACMAVLPVPPEAGGCAAEPPPTPEPGCGPLADAPLPVTLGEPVVLGDLPRAEVDAALAGALPAVASCRPASGEAGRVVAKLAVDRAGKVTKAEATSSTFADPAVGACVAAQLARVALPPPKGARGVVTVPLDLR